MKKRKRPSRTRRHRESVARKRRAMAFYRMRRDAGVLRPDEAEALRPWLGRLAARLFSWTGLEGESNGKGKV